MASLFAPSFIHNPRFLFSPNQNQIIRFSFPRSMTFWGWAKAGGERNIPSPPNLAASKRSLSITTADIFSGMASILQKIRGPFMESPVVSLANEEDAFASANGKRVMSVVSEPMKWKQRPEDLEAERDRKNTCPGFSFSAAGLLFPYHLGVARFLLEKGYIKETTPLAGSSAGAIACAVIASGSNMEDALYAAKILSQDCRHKGTAFRLGEVLRNVLNEFLPEDVHTRSNGRVRVAITQLLWRPRGLLIDQFNSREDLINAVITSSFIPGYLAPRPATRFRNQLCIDGGLTLFMPPTSALKTVKICAFPAKQMRFKDIGISPDCNPVNRASHRQLLSWALEPAEDGVLDQLYEQGYLDAEVWAEQNPANSIAFDESFLN